jgi:tRNA(Ile2) C34 agmatinyltransferase TiaS
MGFPELIQRSVFDQLALGDESARQLFYKRQQSADMEFLDLHIEKTATVLNDNWVQCPLCGDAWESTSLDAMVRCPKCQGLSRNPRYWSAP